MELLSPFGSFVAASDTLNTTDKDIDDGENKGEFLSHLISHHTSSSGFLALTYPSEWSGMIEGTTSSGSIALKGKGLQTYFNRGISRLGKHIVARKGYGRSKMDFRTSSGSIGIKIGEE